MPANEIHALIAKRNVRNHGWDRFQAGTRHAAHRMIRTTVEEMEMTRYEVRTIKADPTGRPDEFWKNPPEPIYYVHDNDRGRHVHGSYTDKTEADRRCAKLNAPPRDPK